MSFPFYAIFPTQISKKYSIVLCYAPTCNGDLYLSKWWPKFIQMGTKICQNGDPFLSEMGTFSSRNGDPKSIFSGQPVGFWMHALPKRVGFRGEESYLIYFMMVSLLNLPRQEFLDCDCYHCEKPMVFKVTIAIEWMVWKQPLVSMVFPMVFPLETMVIQCFFTVGPLVSMVCPMVFP